MEPITLLTNVLQDIRDRANEITPENYQGYHNQGLLERYSEGMEDIAHMASVALEAVQDGRC